LKGVINPEQVEQQGCKQSKENETLTQVLTLNQVRCKRRRLLGRGGNVKAKSLRSVHPKVTSKTSGATRVARIRRKLKLLKQLNM
jgi:hypothetical protein